MWKKFSVEKRNNTNECVWNIYDGEKSNMEKLLAIQCARLVKRVKVNWDNWNGCNVAFVERREQQKTLQVIKKSQSNKQTNKNNENWENFLVNHLEQFFSSLRLFVFVNFATLFLQRSKQSHLNNRKKLFNYLLPARILLRINRAVIKSK